jgi:hypothetical protein
MERQGGRAARLPHAPAAPPSPGVQPMRSSSTGSEPLATRVARRMRGSAAGAPEMAPPAGSPLVGPRRAADAALPVARAVTPEVDALFAGMPVVEGRRGGGAAPRDTRGALPLLQRTLAPRAPQPAAPVTAHGVAADGVGAGEMLARAIEQMWAPAPGSAPGGVVQRVIEGDNVPSTQGGTPPASGGSGAEAPDIEELARQVYARLRRRILIEAERIGR